MTFLVFHAQKKVRGKTQTRAKKYHKTKKEVPRKGLFSSFFCVI